MNSFSHPRDQRLSSTFLGGLFVFSILLRLGMLGVWESRQMEPNFAHDGYIFLAQYWLGWIPTLTEFGLHNPAPGYAAFCALIFKTLGSPNLFVLRLVNVLLSSITCMLVGIFCLRWGGDVKTAKLASLIAACSPAFIFFTPHLQSETFFLFLQALFFVALANWASFNGYQAFGLGIYGGIICLTRSAFAIYLPFLCLALLLKTFHSFGGKKRLILLVVGWSLPMLIWGTTNRIKYGNFIPLTIQSGLTLFAGISLDQDERKANIIPVWEEMEKKGITHWVDQDKYFRNKALTYIRENPLDYVGILIKKFFIFWRPWPRPPYPTVARWGLGVYYTLLFALSLWGIYLSRKNYLKYLPGYALLVALSISHSFFDSSLRYRMPLEIWLCFFAAVAISHVSRSFLDLKTVRRPQPIK